MALPSDGQAFPYVHSFAASENFVVLPIFPLEGSPAAVRAPPFSLQHGPSQLRFVLWRAASEQRCAEML
jgi:hypothetical protein